MVIKKMSEMIDSRIPDEADNNNQPSLDHQNNISEVSNANAACPIM